MLFFGAIKNALVGGYQALTLPRKIEKLQRELDSELLSGLEGLKRFHAHELLLLAELASELEDLEAHDHAGRGRLLQLWIDKMNAAIKDAEASLKREPANKLDVATLAVNIQDLALNTMRELEQHQAQVARQLQVVDQHRAQVNYHFHGMTSKLEAFERTLQELQAASAATAKQSARLMGALGFVGFIAVAAVAVAFLR